VIAQQWTFTYRYPQFGGMESVDLYLPINAPVEFHVTSLDVIHSFWAYQLGVKADANPLVDNVAYTTPEQLGTVTVRWHELPSDHRTAGAERDGQGKLLRNAALGVQEAAREKRESLPARVAKLTAIVAADPDAHFLLWHDSLT